MDKENIKEIYRKRAPSYNFEVKLFNLIGWKANSYRNPAVDALNVKEGNCVVDLCCGTGLNFPHIEKKIGPTGKLIGVDLTDSMLKEAKKQVQQKGWKNVELVNKDATKYDFPKGVNGIITSYAITLIPEFDAVIKKGIDALKEGGRFVVLDFKKPKIWSEWFARFMINVFIKPYGGSYEMKDRHPWESLSKYSKIIEFREFYFGSTYIAAGEK